MNKNTQIIIDNDATFFDSFIYQDVDTHYKFSRKLESLRFIVI